eukprot:10702755-Alexandrium_andersonii.AAC.1
MVRGLRERSWQAGCTLPAGCARRPQGRAVRLLLPVGGRDQDGPGERELCGKDSDSGGRGVIVPYGM